VFSLNCTRFGNMHTDTHPPGANPLPRPTRTLLTVKQLTQQQPGLTEGGVRWDLFNRRTNGLEASGAIFQRGRKILIDPDRYLDWLARGQGRAA
jgi:hypothetical protein